LKAGNDFHDEVRMTAIDIKVSVMFENDCYIGFEIKSLKD